MVCAQVIGNDATVAFAGSQGNFELNVMFPVIGRNLLESINLLANASRVLADRCIDGIVANVDRCRALRRVVAVHRHPAEQVHRLRGGGQGRQAGPQGGQDDQDRGARTGPCGKGHADRRAAGRRARRAVDDPPLIPSPPVPVLTARSRRAPSAARAAAARGTGLVVAVGVAPQRPGARSLGRAVLTRLPGRSLLAGGTAGITTGRVPGELRRHRPPLRAALLRAALRRAAPTRLTRTRTGHPTGGRAGGTGLSRPTLPGRWLPRATPTGRDRLRRVTDDLRRTGRELLGRPGGSIRVGAFGSTPYGCSRPDSRPYGSAPGGGPPAGGLVGGSTLVGASAIGS